MNKRALSALLLLSVSVGLSNVSFADSYPTRPIRVVTVSGAGGTSDIFLRALGVEFQKRTGQPLIIEPRTGGNFTLGARTCAQAPKDGYTICVLNNEALSYNQFLFKKIPYDPEADFTPITNLIFLTTALVTNSALGVKTLDELAAKAKANPKTLAFVAPSMHQRLFFNRFNHQHGSDIVDVPFRGGADAVSNILSGATPVGFFGLASFLPYLRDGKLTALAVDSDQRNPLVPTVPTMTELGYRENLSRAYYGMVAPAGIPESIVNKLQTEIAAIMADASFRSKFMVDRALEPAADTPQAFAECLRKDRITSARNVKAAGLEPQ